LQVGTLKEIVSAVEREKMLDFENKLQEQIIKTNSYHDTKGLHYYYFFFLERIQKDYINAGSPVS
jgi:hypothetical protein